MKLPEPFSPKISRAVALAVASVSLFNSNSLHAASATWNASPTTPGIWEVTGAENNWSTGAGTFPGAIGTTTNADVATFLTSSSTTIAINSTAGNTSALNIAGITFGSGTVTSPNSFTIGSTGGNALSLSSGGTISISSSVVAGANATETINAPLILQPATSSTAGSYTFSNGASSSNNTLVFGGPISTGTTSAAITLTLTGANAGANKITGTLSDTGSGGLILSKTSSGSWTFGGNGTSSLAKGSINVSAGTFNYGVASTDAPTLNITTFASGNVAVDVSGTGTFNMANGTLQANSGIYGLVLEGTQTYNQTGGTFTTNGISALANGGGSSTVNLSGGTLTTTTNRFELAVRGTGTVNLSGTGALTTNQLVMNTTQLASGTASGTFNLNGGTLTTGSIVNGTGGPTGPGNTFNFNGGTLRSSASTTTFMQGLTNAFVKAGGAIIDTQANNDTIGQNLLTDATSTGGGLTKQGAGTLILSGANTYTGANVIALGTLGVTSDASLGAVPGSASSNIQFTGATGGLQDSANNVTLSANRNLSLANGMTATLDSGTNTFTIGGAITRSSGASATTLALTGSGAGAGVLNGAITDSSTGGLIISQTGSGAWTLGGGSSSVLAKGQLRTNAGTLNFGTSSSDTTSLALNGNAASGGNVGIYVLGGTFNMKGGTITTSGTGQGLVVQGTNTVFNQTGGLINTSGSDFIEFANNGTTTQNISGGELRTGNLGRIELNVNGTTSVTNLSGTGLITTPSLVMLSNQTNNATSASTFNLTAGGTLATGAISRTTQTSTGTGSTIFNFNGGTLRATAGSATFLQGLTTTNAPNGGAVIRSGGAIINTNGFSDTIAQPLLHEAALGTTADGGLTKNGAGNLTLTGANTYTGATTVNTGTLLVGAGGSIGATSRITVATGATIQNGNGAAIVGALTLTEGSTLLTNAVGSSFNTATNGLELVGNLSDGFTAIALTNTAGSGLLKGGALTFTLSGITAGTYDLDGASTGFSGSFTSANVNGFALTASGLDYTGTDSSFTYSYTNSSNILSITAVPEPSTWVGAGLMVGLAGWSQRKRLQSLAGIGCNRVA